MRKSLLLAAALGLATAYVPAFAEQGDWLIRAGFLNVVPDDSGDSLDLTPLELPVVEAEVDSAASFTFDITYMIRDNIGIELLAAYPFKHDIEIEGANIAETKHLPPTLSVQYHWTRWGAFKPYAGIGVNWTYFFDEDIDLPVDLDLDDSWGLAFQAGIDYSFKENWFANVVVRYINIETDVEVAGIGVGDVGIDPWLYGAHIGYRF